VKPIGAFCKYCGDRLTRRVQWKRRRYCTAFCREAARDGLMFQPTREQDIGEKIHWDTKRDRDTT
jgi:hypothetical protein